MKKALRLIGTIVLAITVALVGTKELEKVLAQSSGTIPLNSEVVVYNRSGFGTNGLPKFASVLVNTGSDITYTNDAADGAVFTINTTGLYSLTYSGENSNVTIYVNYETTPNVICLGNMSCSTTLYFTASDVVNLAGGSTSTNTQAKFSIVKIR